jgi:hypothetical protein
MKIVSIEIEAYTFDELKLIDAQTESMKEMRRLFGKDTLKSLADHVISATEEHCKKILNTDIDVTIDVRAVNCFDVDVHINSVASQKLPEDSKFNACCHVREAVELVEDIQLYSKTLRNLERKDEHKPAQGEMIDLIDTRTRELTYELIHAVEADFGEDMDQIHTEQWAKTMAIQGGLLFTKEGKVIEGAVNYNQSTGE